MLLLASDGGAASTDWGLQQRLRSAMLTGIAVTVPLIVTLLVLGFVVNFVSGTLNPLVIVVDSALGTPGIPEVAVKAVVLVVVLFLILLIGLVTERRPEDASVENSFDRMMASIPGIGSIYTSFNEMSELLIQSDTESFREVKLVEFPVQDSYALAFLTADTPETVQQATDTENMETLFLPMAPNPVMGGHVIHVSTDRIYDVEMTVQEGIRATVTSGVAIEDVDESTRPDEVSGTSTVETDTNKGTDVRDGT